MKYTDASQAEIDNALSAAWNAFYVYRKVSLHERAELMRSIASGLEAVADKIVEIAMEETNLPAPRLKNELARTAFQLRSYGAAAEQGNWLEARIDTADTARTPPKPDIRKMLIPIGPVVVFGASNFPFAYSTAGGDTACALAAGCPVIVKAHPAHAETSEMVAGVIKEAVKKHKLPEGIFSHIHGAGIETGKALVQHRYVKAVGFTGSFQGGKALFDWANQRSEPIPVFAEMGSINPVFLLPEKLQSSPKQLAEMYSASITLSVGQFCTNPGLIIGIESLALKEFIQHLGEEISKVQPAKMLHTGIAKSYSEKKSAALAQAGVQTEAIVADDPAVGLNASAVIASVSATAFLDNPLLHQEVFGPYSLVVRCRTVEEMTTVAKHIEGQLTSTLLATENDVLSNQDLVEAVKDICGRLIINGVPTGVEVCLAMQHGGPFPATTDSRFTSVGADGIKRFARPLSFQSWPDSLLPDELKNSNPLSIYRTVNNELTKEHIS